LVVQESQAAVFFRDGKALDVFGPGRHTLSTANMPVLTDFLQAALTGGKTVFQAEVVFVNQRILTDLKWGTPNPIDMKDPDLGWVQLRAFGTFSVRISEPQLFVNTLVGAMGYYTSQALNQFLKGSLRTHLNDLVGTAFESYAKIRSNTEELAAAMKVKVRDDFAKYGIELRDFFIQDISVPEEIQEAFRMRARMGALGVQNFMQYKAAEAMGDMARNQGAGGAAMSMGAGMGMGMIMPQMMQQQMAPGMMGMGGMPMQQGMMPMQQQMPMQQMPVQPQAPPAQAPGVACPSCKTEVPQGAKFCLNCGTAMPPPMPAVVTCPGCQAQLPAGARFCANCGTKLS
ncbi:MAG: SPFH domain-containing protein, partial [Candidatus Eremiobacterota bacterium]